MASSLSSLVDNFSEGLHSDKCADFKYCYEYMVFKDAQLICRCFECEKNYKKDFNKELIKRFANIYQFCNEDINKFILLLRKGVYPYEYMDSWERFDETSLPHKEAFYSSLNMESITDMQREFLKILIIKILVIIMVFLFRVRQCYLQMYLKILEMNVLKYMGLDPAHFVAAPGLAWQACLKKTGI